MGQKSHPGSLRLGIIKDWDAIWFAENKGYADTLKEDLALRSFLKQSLYRAGISRLKISRRANQVTVDIFTARPGLLIGKGGKEANYIRDKIVAITGKQVELNIKEEEKAGLSSALVAENIAYQLEKRIAFRRAMRQAMTKVLAAGAKGIKVMCAGRLGGSEIARTEWYRKGRVPLQTLRADIDYGFAEAMTIYGKIGIKVWIYRGDILKNAANAKKD